MAKQTYGYSSNSIGITSDADNMYASRSFADSYLSAGASLRDTYSRYLSADTLSGAAAISSSMIYNYESHSGMVSGLPLTSATHYYGPPGVDIWSTGATDALAYTGLKRTSSESWYSTNPLAKRFRYENTSHLPIYPQRPGEKDCAYYMQTRTCKFGDSCKFDHPIWVPEGESQIGKRLHFCLANTSLKGPGSQIVRYLIPSSYTLLD